MLFDLHLLNGECYCDETRIAIVKEITTGEDSMLEMSNHVCLCDIIRNLITHVGLEDLSHFIGGDFQPCKHWSERQCVQESQGYE